MNINNQIVNLLLVYVLFTIGNYARLFLINFGDESFINYIVILYITPILTSIGLIYFSKVELKNFIIKNVIVVILLLIVQSLFIYQVFGVLITTKNNLFETLNIFSLLDMIIILFSVGSVVYLLTSIIRINIFKRNK